MALHSRSAAAQTVSILDLSDDLLAACLAPLDLRQRLASVCLVSKRFHAVCDSPELLRILAVRRYGLQAPQTASSIAAWLAQRGRHLRSLTLRLHYHTSDIPQGMTPDLQRCLVSCPNLRQLDASGPLPDQPFLATSLTRLALNNWRWERLPPQVGALCNLRRLALDSMSYALDSTDQLATLTALTRLELEDVPLPRCLSQLTWLRHLQLRSTWDSLTQLFDQQQLDAAVSGLQQLTFLSVETERARPEAMFRLPPALSSMCQLHHLLFLTHGYTVPDRPPEQRLPAGPWLGNLRRLCLQWGNLTRSHALLAGAPHLEELTVVGDPLGDTSSQADWEGFWSWARSHSALHLLDLHDDYYREEWELVGGLEGQLKRLRQLRPALHVEQTYTGEGYSSERWELPDLECVLEPV